MVSHVGNWHGGNRTRKIAEDRRKQAVIEMHVHRFAHVGVPSPLKCERDACCVEMCIEPR